MYVRHCFVFENELESSTTGHKIINWKEAVHLMAVLENFFQRNVLDYNNDTFVSYFLVFPIYFYLLIDSCIII